MGERDNSLLELPRGKHVVDREHLLLHPNSLLWVCELSAGLGCSTYQVGELGVCLPHGWRLRQALRHLHEHWQHYTVGCVVLLLVVSPMASLVAVKHAPRACS